MNRRLFFSKLMGATILSAAAKMLPVKRDWSHRMLQTKVPKGYFMMWTGVLKPMTRQEMRAFMIRRMEFYRNHDARSYLICTSVGKGAFTFSDDDFSGAKGELVPVV